MVTIAAVPCIPINSFAAWVIGMVSVGLKAVALVSEV